MRSAHSLARAAGGIALLFAASTAFGQQAPPAPAAGAPAQSSPSVTYGDWALRCVTTPPPADAKGAAALKTCEIAQTVQLKGQNTILAQLAVGRTKPGEPLRLTVLLPPNVGLPSAVDLVLDEKSKTKLELVWRRCIPGACVAELSLSDKAIQLLRASKGTPHLAYPNAAGAANAVVFSLNGFGDAVDALNKAYQ